MEKLEKEIRDALNRCCAENASNTPDFILAQYLIACLSAFNTVTQQRDTWYGRNAAPTAPPDDQPAGPLAGNVLSRGLTSSTAVRDPVTTGDAAAEAQIAPTAPLAATQGGQPRCTSDSQESPTGGPASAAGLTREQIEAWRQYLHVRHIHSVDGMWASILCDLALRGLDGPSDNEVGAALDAQGEKSLTQRERILMCAVLRWREGGGVAWPANGLSEQSLHQLIDLVRRRGYMDTNSTILARWREGRKA